MGAPRRPRRVGTPSKRGTSSRPPFGPAIAVQPAKKRRFRERLLKWYARHGRDLPWRTTTEPYHILVSEIMLQQTQVDRVLPKYREWLAKYPTMEDLAEASLDEVTRTWYPLGYNIRPVRLHGIARESVARYGGTLPRDPEQLQAFKGIGRYTAGAIRSFAFQEDAPILDTNVMRVLHRVFVGAGDPKKRKAALWDLAGALVPKGRGYDFNQALMDFGATVCIARDPYCLLCPMQDFCMAYPFSPGGGPADAPPGPIRARRGPADAPPGPTRPTRP
ncbi:MAG TPA: A/G-specific adenine glycosylase [Nitrospirales bacterium]|nr:A/G-specific adenine glycosylase [Nitrospirales bacterium]